MTLVVFSPHTDDAVFSVGEHLIDRADDIIIATPFAGVPTDDAGREKHLRLNREHDDACRALQASVVSGPFLDDVYPPTYSHEELRDWCWSVIVAARTNDIWVPLGIHHPDHILIHSIVSELCSHSGFSVYSELPYRIRWSDEAFKRWEEVGSPRQSVSMINRASENKQSLVMLYESQVMKRDATGMLTGELDEQLISDIMQPEFIWRLS